MIYSLHPMIPSISQIVPEKRESLEYRILAHCLRLFVGSFTAARFALTNVNIQMLAIQGNNCIAESFAFNSSTDVLETVPITMPVSTLGLIDPTIPQTIPLRGDEGSFRSLAV